MTEPSLSREDVLLLLAHGADGPFPLDPIRLMKGAFLVVQRGRESWRDLYDFSAYDYGPFDRSVYVARDRLVVDGLLSADSSGRRYPAHSLTDIGRTRAEELLQADPAGAPWISEIGRYVASKSFDTLLDEVYAAYPDFAARSVLRR